MKIKLQGVIMDAVVEENPQYQAEITDKAVEKGQDISDHVKFQGARVHLKGSMVDDAANKLEILRGYLKEGTLLTYVGRNAFSNMVLISLSTDHAVDNADGFHYDISLKQVRIAVPQTFEAKAQNPETKKQDTKTSARVKANSNVGRKQVQTTNEKTGSIVEANTKPVAQMTPIAEKVLNQSLEDTLKIGMGLGGSTKKRAKTPQKVQIRGKEYEVY